MRAFVAITLPADVRANLAALAERLRAAGVKARWPRRENLHLTLRFLGDITPERAAAVAAALAETSRREAPLPLAVRGVGVFPNMRRPAVIWAGVHTSGDALARVQAAAEAAAQAAGLPAEKKPFHPHVTVGRLRDPRRPGRLPALLAAEEAFHAGEFLAEAVVLCESALTPNGAVYTLVHSLPLTGEDSR